MARGDTLKLSTNSKVPANGDSRCLVIIPFHKERMSDAEHLSLINTIKTLKAWDVLLILPKHVDASGFERIRRKEKVKFRIANLPSGMMGSIERYNQMCLNPKFYEMFEKFEYLLIVHLDAWIFKDELDRWLDSEFDYVGAPLFLPQRGRNLFQKVRNKKVNNLWRHMIPEVGNGGLSLRKVSAHIEVLNHDKARLDHRLFLVYLHFLIRNFHWKFLGIFLRHLYDAHKNSSEYRKKHLVYEDVFISGVLNLLNRHFKVAPARTSLAFALETHQKQILTTNSNLALPLGLHGWDKVFTINEIARLTENKELLSRRFDFRIDL